MPEIDDETRQIIATLQRNLLQIKLTKKAPINLTQYRNMGLIRIVDRHKMHCGRKTWIGSDLYLTEKGNRMLSAMIPDKEQN